jgi:protein-S-isoprenylcysteine O-methyltransferase Ste14
MIKSRLAVSTILSVIAYLGLAIIGAGGPGRFFSYPPLIAVSVVTIALGVVSLFSEGHIGSGVREDRSNRWVVAALGVLRVLDAYIPAYTDRIDFVTFGGEGVRWLGVLLYTVGGILRLAPVFVLGRRFSGLVAIQSGHQLVSGGLYGIIRHPSYSFSCLVGDWRSALVRASSLPCCRSVSCWRAFELRSDCSARPSAPNTRLIEPAPGLIPYVY